jgi:hypothetical protein
MISRVKKEEAVMAARFGQQYQAWAVQASCFLLKLRA